MLLETMLKIENLMWWKKRVLWRRTYVPTKMHACFDFNLNELGKLPKEIYGKANLRVLE